MSTRLARHESGNIVFAALCEGDWTITEGCEETALTPAQWHTGLAYIRDILAEAHTEPIIYDAKTRRYALAKFETEVDEYIKRRIKTFAVQLARIRNGSFAPARVKFETPGIPKFRRLDDSLSRVFTDLEFVLEDLGEEMPANVRAIMRKTAAANGST